MIPKKKIIGILLVCAMLGVVIPALSGNSSAQNAIPQVSGVIQGWNGYDGNNVIYITNTSHGGSNYKYGLSSIYSCVSPQSYKYTSNSRNVVSSYMQTALSPTDQSVGYFSSFQAFGSHGVNVQLNMINIGSDKYYYCKDPAAYKLVTGMQDYVTLSGIKYYTGSHISAFYQGNFNNGVNLSMYENTSISPCTSAALQAASYGLSFVPVLGPLYSTAALGYELSYDFGTAHPASRQCLINNGYPGTIYQDSQVILGTGTINGNTGENHYLSVTQAEICIPLKSYTPYSSASITFGAKSLITTGGDQSCHIGANSSQTIDLKPAISVCGNVYNGPKGGSQYTNKNICLIQTYNGVSTGFQLTTNNNGFWHFFAEPGATYMLAGGSTPSWGYSVLNIPSSDTSVANVGKDFQIPESGKNFNINAVSLSGTVNANGNPVQNAGVEVLINSSIQYTTTNSNGQFNMLVPANSWVNVSISAGSYSYTVQSADVGSGTSFTMTFSYTTKSTSGGGGGGGGGGCVLYGTNITLANGLTTQVQNLYKGEKILSYNTHTHRLFKDKVKQIIITNNVTSVIRIDNFISLSGPNVQPVYVKTAHGRKEWIFLGQITKGMSLYNPQNNTWVRVTSITIVIGHFTVYEVVGSKEFWSQGHRRSDYIANGILVDRKIGYPIGGY